MTEQPPKARACIRVGISGHREPPKLPADAIPSITETVGNVLEGIRNVALETFQKHAAIFSRDPAELVLISALAEGSDRIVAQAALERAYVLDAVLPFARDEYENDFETGESKTEYRRLLGLARSKFELDGVRGKDKRAYEAAGLVMLANIDLLIAIWDSKEPSGVGGTGEIVERAMAARVPIVMIEPKRPKEALLLWTGEMNLAPSAVRIEDVARQDANSGISRVVPILLGPPPPKKKRQWLTRIAAALGRELNFEYLPIAQYFEETERRRIAPLGSIYPLFLRVFGGGWSDSVALLAPYVESTRAKWHLFFQPRESLKAAEPQWPIDDTLSTRLERELLPAAAFADNLAVLYGSRYRGAFVASYALAALAVGLALLGIYFHAPAEKIGWVILELITIALILIIWFQGGRGEWHRRWLEYRLLGEWLRHMRILALVGSGGPITRPTTNIAPDSEWVLWYARAIRRALPLCNRQVDEPFLDDIRSRLLASEIDGQLRYNVRNEERMETVETRIHWAGSLLFLATFVLGSLFVFRYYVSPDFFGTVAGAHFLEHLTFFAALLPTIGAALNAIRVQADFETVAHRSKATKERLQAIEKALTTEPLEFALLSDRINKAVDVLSSDIEEWHVLFRTRPLSLPA
jgi:hypothetical protein